MSRVKGWFLCRMFGDLDEVWGICRAAGNSITGDDGWITMLRWLQQTFECSLKSDGRENLIMRLLSITRACEKRKARGT